MLKSLFVALLLITTHFSGIAQLRSQYMTRYATLGFGGGSSHYFGDLVSYSKPVRSIMTLPRWNGTVQYTYFANPRMMARVSFSWIRLMGDDFTFTTTRSGKIWGGQTNRFFRNANFRNDLKEFVVSGVYNLRPQYNRSHRQRDFVMPYITAGIGFYAHDPQTRVRFAEYKGTTADPSVAKPSWVSTINFGTAGQGAISSVANAYPLKYNGLQFTFPVGLGIRYRIKDNIDLTIEGAFRFTPFDYLDDVGSQFANPADLANSDGTNTIISIPTGMIPTNGTTAANSANLSQILSDRSLEAYAARKNISREAAYRDALAKLGKPQTGTIPEIGSFFDPGVRVYGYDGRGRNIGGVRFTKTADSYATIQVALHFILNTGVKCPPID